MLLSELRISDLVRIKPHGEAAAYMVGTVQREVYAKSGHMLQVYAEGTWRELRKSCKNGKVGSVVLTCGRCGVAGRTIEWFILATEGKRGYRRLWHTEPVEQHPRLHDMAHACPGDAIAADLHDYIIGQIEARWRGRPAPVPELANGETADGHDTAGGS